MLNINQRRVVLFSQLCIIYLAVSTQAIAKTHNKASGYHAAQQKSAITTHSQKFKRRKKIRELNPFPLLKRPNLNGNFYPQQQYRAAQQQLKIQIPNKK